MSFSISHCHPDKTSTRFKVRFIVLALLAQLGGLAVVPKWQMRMEK